MKKSPILLLAVFMVVALTPSCNLDKDDIDDNPNTYPDLTVSVTVSGAVTDSFTFTNTENTNSDGTYGLSSTHSQSDSELAIAGIVAPSTIYSTSIELSTVQTGVFNLESGLYSSTQPSAFAELQGGTLSITNVNLLWTQGISQIYSIDGTWSMELENDEDPAETITFTCSFDNLIVVSAP